MEEVQEELHNNDLLRVEPSGSKEELTNPIYFEPQPAFKCTLVRFVKPNASRNSTVNLGGVPFIMKLYSKEPFSLVSII